MHRLAVIVGLLCWNGPLLAQDRIEDNSFLIEEAYNQESGVVQHISTFARASMGDWEYTFTQEWPFLGQANQVGFTIPVAGLDAGAGRETRIGDVALNYRRQLLGIGGGRVALSPRLSLLLPTGREESGHGAGGLGLQANLPVSLLITGRLVTHYNAGFTLTPRARNGAGARASAFGYHVGGSAILLLTQRLNLMVEGLWLSNQDVVAGDLTAVVQEAYLNPGFRYAIDTPGGLQIVPGIAYTIGLGPSEGDNSIFVYLSLEHRFKTSDR